MPEFKPDGVFFAPVSPAEDGHFPAFGTQGFGKDFHHRRFARTAAGEITDDEWQAAKKSMENAYRQLSDSPSAMEVYYLGRALAGASVSPEEGIARVTALTREDIVRVAQKMQIDTVFVLHQTGVGEEQTDEED